MIYSAIQKLIDSFCYEEAIDIIRQYGNAAIAETYGQYSHTSFTESKLIDELLRIQDLPDFATPAPEPTPHAGEEPVSDPTILDLRNKRNEIVRQRDFLRGQLTQDQSIQDRCNLASQIVSLTHELNSIWDQLEFYQEHGIAMPKDPDNELEKLFEGITNPLEIDRIIKNHKTYLTKANKGDRPSERIPFYLLVISEGQKRLTDVIQD